MASSKDNQHELVKVTLRIPKGVLGQVEQIRKKRGPAVRQIDIWREAILRFIDDQTDVIGSRAHFHHTLRERLDEHEGRILALLTDEIRRVERIQSEMLDAIFYNAWKARIGSEYTFGLTLYNWAAVRLKDVSDEAIKKLIDISLPGIVYAGELMIEKTEGREVEE